MGIFYPTDGIGLKVPVIHLEHEINSEGLVGGCHPVPPMGSHRDDGRLSTAGGYPKIATVYQRRPALLAHAHGRDEVVFRQTTVGRPGEISPELRKLKKRDRECGSDFIHGYSDKSHVSDQDPSAISFNFSHG